MKTELQLRTDVYNALNNNSDIPVVYWIGNPPVNPSYPSVWYSKLETIGDYVFETHLNSEIIQFQIEVRTDPNNVTNMDTILQAVKDSMHGLKYRNIFSPEENLETETNKVVRPTRWEWINV